MAPRGHKSRRGHFGLHLHPVRTWWPGKGTPFSAPSARVFYTSKVRAKLGWWQAERASKAVHTQPNGKQRTVHNYRRINSHARKATCRYESVRDLPALLAPNHYLLSCDCEKAFWSIPLHKRTAHFLSFHFALPERVVLENGGT